MKKVRCLLLPLVASAANSTAGQCAIDGVAAMTVLHTGQLSSFSSDNMKFDASAWPGLTEGRLGLMYVRGTRDEYSNEYNPELTCGGLVHQIGSWSGAQSDPVYETNPVTAFAQRTGTGPSSAVHAIASHLSGLGWNFGAEDPTVAPPYIVLVVTRPPVFGSGWDASTADCQTGSLPTQEQFVQLCKQRRARFFVGSPKEDVRKAWTDVWKDGATDDGYAIQADDLFLEARKTLDMMGESTRRIDVFIEPPLVEKYMGKIAAAVAEDSGKITFSLTLFDAFPKDPLSGMPDQVACYWPLQADVQTSEVVSLEGLSADVQYWSTADRNTSLQQSPVTMALVRAAKLANWTKDVKQRILLMMTSDRYVAHADTDEATGSGGCARVPAESEVVSALETADVKVMLWLPRLQEAITWMDFAQKSPERVTVAYGTDSDAQAMLDEGLRKLLCKQDVAPGNQEPWTLQSTKSSGMPLPIIGAAVVGGTLLVGASMCFARRLQSDDDDDDDEAGEEQQALGGGPSAVPDGAF